MLNKISINLRMLILIALPLLVLLYTGYTSFATLQNDVLTLEESDHNAKEIISANKIIHDVNKFYIKELEQINGHVVPWESAQEEIEAGIKHLKGSSEEFIATLSGEEMKLELVNRILADKERLISSYANIAHIFDIKDTPKTAEVKKTTKKAETDKKGKVVKVKAVKKSNENLHAAGYLALSEYIKTDMYPLSDSLIDDLETYEAQKQKLSHDHIRSEITLVENTIKTELTIVAISLLVILLVSGLISTSITSPVKKLIAVIKKQAEGETESRAETLGTDEVAELGTAFNSLLDERTLSQEKAEAEHMKLNQSVFKLLQTVAELSERNLTVRAEVTEDATGPVADALNLLAEETSATLVQVRDVAAEVNGTSETVNTHLMTVNKLAMREQEQAIETADQMDDMLSRVDAIAKSAALTNTMADAAKESTTKAHQSVSGTLEGMSEIRETVQETGKRIKQLGERSQEISHVIEIINTIAERTTVLALNASMQSAAAGDAGRGFSVIAEEIQRLAESSRESTGQISTLVKNIQQETNTTIATMDKTIEQVVDGSTRAEDAAVQMKEVLETTSQLVTSVNQIASSARDQVEISESLKHKAQSIMKSTQSTGQELLSLTGLSRNMSDYAQQLVKSVNVFTLDNKDTNKTDKAEA